MEHNQYKKKLEIANSVNLIEYLEIKYPFVIVQKGRRYYHTNHDSLEIQEHYWRRFSEGGRGGDVVSFLTEWLDFSHLDAINELCNFNGDISEPLIPSKREESDVKTEYNIPEMRPEKRYIAFNYLTKVRQLDPDIINKLLDTGMVYADKNNNVVFVNDTETFAVLRGTHIKQGETKATFKRTIVKEQYQYITFMPEAPIKRVYITEGIMDAIALYMILKPELKEGACFCAMAGLIPKTVERIISDFEGANFVMAVDSDSAGDKFAKRYPYPRIKIPNEYLKEKNEKNEPVIKDWNDFLIAINKEKNR